MDESRQIVTVPNLSALELLESVQLKTGVKDMCRDLIGWDFMKDEGGKTYEAMWHQWYAGRGSDAPNEGNVSNEEIRAFFCEHGFAGNTAAFITLISQDPPVKGMFATVPEEDRLDWRSEYSYRPATCGCAPTFSLRSFSKYAHHLGWIGCFWKFVAFREAR